VESGRIHAQCCGNGEGESGLKLMERRANQDFQSSSSSFSSSSSIPSSYPSRNSRTRTTTRTIRHGLLFAAGLLVAGTLVHGAEKLALPPDNPGFKAGPGSEIAMVQCVLCHSADYVSTQPRLPRAAWKANVLKMRDKYGAPLPDDKVEALVDYLVKTYGAEAPK